MHGAGPTDKAHYAANPFNDPNLHVQFKWAKKDERTATPQQDIQAGP